MSSLLIQNGILAETGEKISVVVEDGIIRSAGGVIADRTIDATGKIIFPGLIDCHVHFREPGLEYKATMKTESEAALFGGVTTVCEMPNTMPPTVTVAALQDKVKRAEGMPIDLRFFFGITKRDHLLALETLLLNTSGSMAELRQKLAGVKIYLEHSTGNQKIDPALIEDVFKLCGDHHITLVAHCEDPEIIEQTLKNPASGIAAHSLFRPPEAETKAIAGAIDLARKYDTRFHVAHISTKDGTELVRQAKADRLAVTSEASPHHLFLTTDDYAALGALGKMNPPLRNVEHRDALWEGITDNTIDCIATDHAPHTLKEKTVATPLDAPSGVPGVETMLPLLLSVAAGFWPHGERPNATFGYADIVRLCFKNPNDIFGLKKSTVTIGKTADIVIVDSQKEQRILASRLHSKCGWTPFEGWTVVGSISHVIRGSREVHPSA